MTQLQIPIVKDITDNIQEPIGYITIDTELHNHIVALYMNGLGYKIDAAITPNGNNPKLIAISLRPIPVSPTDSTFNHASTKQDEQRVRKLIENFRSENKS